MTAPDNFEDRLLEQLRHLVAEQPAPSGTLTPQRPRRTRLILAGAGGAAAIAAVAIAASSGDVTSRAYAVDAEPDGAVTVSIKSLKDAGGLQDSLRAAGVPAVVDYVAAGQKGCVAPPPLPPAGGPTRGTLKKVKPGEAPDGTPTFSTGGPPGKPGAPKMATGVMVTADGTATFSVTPSTIAPGQKLFITTSSGTVNTIGMAISKSDPSGDCPGSD